MKNRIYLCARCAKPLGENRPVFLVADESHQILGPLHAACAEYLHLTAKHQVHTVPPTAQVFGRVIPKEPECLEPKPIFPKEEW